MKKLVKVTAVAMVFHVIAMIVMILTINIVREDFVFTEAYPLLSESYSTIVFLFWLIEFPAFGLLAAYLGGVFWEDRNRKKLGALQGTKEEWKLRIGFYTLMALGMYVFLLFNTVAFTDFVIISILLIGCVIFYHINAKKIGHSVVTAFGVWIAGKALYLATLVVLIVKVGQQRLDLEPIMTAYFVTMIMAYQIVKNNKAEKYTKYAIWIVLLVMTFLALTTPSLGYIYTTMTK